MFERLVEGIVAGGPLFALFGVMLWLWVKQAEKHEQHWHRLVGDHFEIERERNVSTFELAKVLGKMELLLERMLPCAPGYPRAEDDSEAAGEGTNGKRR